MTSTPSLEEIRGWHERAGQVTTGEGLTEAEAIDAIRALEELKAAAAAAQARVTAHLHAGRSRREAAEGVPAAKRCAGLSAEVALARRVSPHEGSRHLGTALALTREMPHTLAALTEGRISEWAATVLVRETATLSVEHRAEVDRRLAPHLTERSGWGVRRLANEARRVGYRLDPGSAIRRVRGAQTDRRVSLRPAPDTMTYLTGFLPVAQGVACQVALTRQADTLKAQGDPRSRGQIMADTLVERLTGQASATGVPVEIGLVMTDRALLADSDEPAHLVGYGTIPAHTGRMLARDAERAWVRRLYTHPVSGALVATDSRRRLFAGQLRQRLLLTDDTCATPWCDAPVRHADHVTPAKDGGVTAAGNGAGLCAACNYTKELPGWHTTLTTRSDGTRVLDLTDPTGHRQQSHPPDPPGAPDRGTRLLRRFVA
jgi:hypothetical protein